MHRCNLGAVWKSGRLGWEEGLVNELASELVEGLTGLGRPAEAAAIAANRLNDTDGAVYLFCQAHEWRQVCVSYWRFQSILQLKASV